MNQAALKCLAILIFNVNVASLVKNRRKMKTQIE